LIRAADRQDLVANTNITSIEGLLTKLQNDSDVGVSKVARKSLGSVGDILSKK
jgi:hypothetical protein